MKQIRFPFRVMVVFMVVAAGYSLAFDLTDGLMSSDSKMAPNELGKVWKESTDAEALGDYEKAFQRLRSYEVEGGDTFFASLREGWLNYLLKKYSLAEDAYNTAAKLKPSAVNPLLGLLNVEKASAAYDKIVPAAERILHVDPTNYTAQMAIGDEQTREKNYQQALGAYRRILMFYPDDLTARNGEAWALYNLGQNEAASADFKLLLSLVPDYPNAKQGLTLSTPQTAQNE